MPPPGLLAHFVKEMPLGSQIALYGPYQRLSAAVVDSPNSIACTHKHYQLGFFKKAKPRLVSLFEHRRLEHYAQRILSQYVIPLDAEQVPKWFRSFRDQRAVWVDIYTTPPDFAGYDYVFYVDKEKIRIGHSPEPPPQIELPLK